MTKVDDLNIGVIEGFFGRPWTWKNRNAYAEFLKEQGFQFYIYAPKDDVFLRKRWSEPWPPARAKQMAALARYYREVGVQFGIGFSPFEIYLNYDSDAKTKLKKKVREINSLNPDILCILFDDMQGDLPMLAQMQADIVHFLAEMSTAEQVILCPTYYSYDPILSKIFGRMPEQYLADLGRSLDQGIQLFWTGPKVISKEYPVPHLEEVAGLLQRKPFLWDNCLANDAEKLTNFLRLSAFKHQPGLADWTSGHMVNPMNQACLSRLPLKTLKESYLASEYSPAQAFFSACHQLCGTELARDVIEDLTLFEDIGLSGLDENARAALVAKYGKYPENPYAAELVDWLKGVYQFDPACLTG
ncbi:MAG: beta-N-acetylglucosaminidase domain-containing protein [SAR324 cluster bacterium]|nr:beta-N-acetylglucosaminidase domain-containing protein [SAR324 cluster bacterium]